MSGSSRREFLKMASAAGMALSGKHPGAPWAWTRKNGAATRPTCRIFLDSRRALPALDRKLFGSFLEHLGRAIYQGIYEPQSKLANADGFRKDIVEEVRKMGVPVVRYPGGNFVSGYRWLDGVGPKADRPKVLDKAWNTLESNQVGTSEFLAWSKLAGTQPLLAVNLGTDTPESAAALVEYCNVDRGTKWSDLRRKHGVDGTYGVKAWCLGNEMDGPWQIGHMTAAEYGEKAADAGRQMRSVDPSLQLIACGSSGPGMPTYLEWDREVLEQCYEYVDGISLHRYFGNTTETGGDSARFLALNLNMEKQISEVGAVCDMVQGHKRSSKRLWLSFDEWNVWYRTRGKSDMDGKREEAPHLLEEVYNLEDALLVGGLLNSLMRHSDRVRIACLAQLINVIAPIMTNEKGFYRQTIFYPYNWALQYAGGSVLELLVEDGSSYEVANLGQVRHVDVAATHDSSSGLVSVFILNRDLSNPQKLEITWDGQPGSKLLTSLVLTGTDLKAANGFDAPEKVQPQEADKPITGGVVSKIEVPPRSYSVYQWTT